MSESISMESTVEVEDRETIEEITNVLASKGYFNGIERPAVRRWFLTWELGKKINETEAENSIETPGISPSTSTSP